jgi:hypothetical protein
VTDEGFRQAKNLPLWLRPQARFGGQPPAGRLLGRRWKVAFAKQMTKEECRSASAPRVWCYRDPVLHLFHRFAVPLPPKGKVLVWRRFGKFN